VSIPEQGRIDIIRGQALDIIISVPNGINIDGATAELGIADSQLSAYTITLPSTTNGQAFMFALEGADSLNLTGKTHYYSCWMLSGGVPTPIARGVIGVTDDSRNK